MSLCLCGKRSANRGSVIWGLPSVLAAQWHQRELCSLAPSLKTAACKASQAWSSRGAPPSVPQQMWIVFRVETRFQTSSLLNNYTQQRRSANKRHNVKVTGTGCLEDEQTNEQTVETSPFTVCNPPPPCLLLCLCMYMRVHSDKSDDRRMARGPFIIFQNDKWTWLLLFQYTSKSVWTIIK